MLDLTYFVQTPTSTWAWFQLGIGLKLTIKELVNPQASYGVKFVNSQWCTLIL